MAHTVIYSPSTRQVYYNTRRGTFYATLTEKFSEILHMEVDSMQLEKICATATDWTECVIFQWSDLAPRS
jgi:gamma-glutamylcysteine synthetase